MSGAFPDVKGGGSWEGFSYDHADNILNHYATSFSVHEETVKTNRIKDYNAELYTYDEWGNYLSVYNGQKRRGFRFNAEHVLIGSSGEYRGKHYSAEYEYDALGRRIGKKVSYFADRLQEETLETQETRFIWMGMQMIEERQAQSQGVSPALASELIAKNIHPDQYIPKPKESLYRYIYRPDGSYEPLAQIRKLTTEEREAAQQNNPYYRQIPDYRLPAIEESSDEKSLKTDEIRYYQNHLNGAPEELVDSAGNILWAENPTAWGQDPKFARAKFDRL
ncbi:RHS domain-containing protein [Ignatzschineria sp. LJL83]